MQQSRLKICLISSLGFVNGEPGNHFSIKAGDPDTNSLQGVYDG
eukprot:SAG11_NODE_16248_length_553_cov_0.874449_1_plen_43_part_10